MLFGLFDVIGINLECQKIILRFMEVLILAKEQKAKQQRMCWQINEW